MAELSESDRRQISEALATALGREPSAQADMAELGVDDLKRFFCENWDLAKTLLGVLARLVPGLKPIIEFIIRLGDLLKDQICTG